MSGLLEHSQERILSQLLVDLGLASTPVAPLAAWPVYYGHRPDAPDNILTCYATEGRTSGRTMYDGETQRHHGFQVAGRSNGSAGYTKLNEIANALDTLINRTVVTVESSEYLIHSISLTTDVLSLGYEQGTRRRLYTLNGIAAIRMTLVGTGS